MAAAAAAAVEAKAPPMTPLRQRIREIRDAALAEATRVRTAPPSAMVAGGGQRLNGPGSATKVAHWLVRTVKTVSHEKQHGAATKPVPRYSDQDADTYAGILLNDFHVNFEEYFAVRTATSDVQVASVKATLPELLFLTAVATAGLRFKVTPSEVKQAAADWSVLDQTFFAPRDAWANHMTTRRIRVLETVIVRDLNRKYKSPAAMYQAQLQQVKSEEQKEAVKQLWTISFASYALTYLSRLAEKHPVKSSVIVADEQVKALFHALRPILMEDPSNAFRNGGQELIKQITLGWMAEIRYRHDNRENMHYYSTDDVMKKESKILVEAQIVACNMQQRLPVRMAAGYTDAELKELARLRAEHDSVANGTAQTATVFPGSLAAAAAPASADNAKDDSKDVKQPVHPPVEAAAAAAAAAAETSTAAAASNVPMNNTTADAWLFQAFRNWFASLMLYDFMEHCILWNDWNYPGRCRNRLSDTTKDRRPIVVCLGEDHWYVHHNGEFLHSELSITRQRNTNDPCDRTLLRALSLWCMLVVTEFKGLTKNGRRLSMQALWPTVRDAETVVSELARQARDNARKWRQHPPSAHTLLRSSGGGGKSG